MPTTAPVRPGIQWGKIPRLLIWADLSSEAGKFPSLVLSRVASLVLPVIGFFQYSRAASASMIVPEGGVLRGAAYLVFLLCAALAYYCFKGKTAAFYTAALIYLAMAVGAYWLAAPGMALLYLLLFWVMFQGGRVADEDEMSDARERWAGARARAAQNTKNEGAAPGPDAPLLGESTEEKVCPKCAETVKAAAQICRFCGSSFVSENSASPS